MKNEQRTQSDLQRHRRWGLALVAFVAVQIGFLFLDVAVLSPPLPDAPINEWRATIAAHSDLLTWHPLVTLVAFFGLFIPGVFGLREKLMASTEKPWLDLAMAGAIFIVVTLILAEMALVVLGLLPAQDLSDSVLRMLVMANTYAVWVAGGFAAALFLGAASMALLIADSAPRWLAWLGFVGVGFASLGVLWLVPADFSGVLFGLGMLGRALFLVWVVASGVWLYRVEPTV